MSTLLYIIYHFGLHVFFVGNTKMKKLEEKEEVSCEFCIEEDWMSLLSIILIILM